MSGFWRTCGASVPSGAKNIRRGPSDVKRSGSWAAVNDLRERPGRVRRVARLEHARQYGDVGGRGGDAEGVRGGASARALTPGVTHAGSPSDDGRKRPPQRARRWK